MAEISTAASSVAPSSPSTTLVGIAETVAEPEMSRPYRPAWIHALGNAIERIPGPTWLAYIVLSGTSIVLIHTQAWSTGVAIGTFDAANVFWGVLPFALIWLVGYLDRVAAAAFDAFRPALDAPAMEVARLRYELTTVPARPALALAATMPILTIGSYLLDPVATGVAGLPIPILAARVALESFNGAVLFALLYQQVRQVRQVRRILARSTSVDLFQPGPIYAFSHLTSRTGIAIVAIVGASIIAAPPPTTDAAFWLGWAPYLVIPPTIAALAFVVPLYGMHGRLVAEKERLQDDAEARLRRVLAETNRAVDGSDFARIDGLNKALASILQQREVLARLPTWPWSAGTLRGFVSAILLPLGLFLAQQALGRLL